MSTEETSEALSCCAGKQKYGAFLVRARKVFVVVMDVALAVAFYRLAKPLHVCMLKRMIQQPWEELLEPQEGKGRGLGFHQEQSQSL